MKRRNSEVGQMLAPVNEFVLTNQSTFKLTGQS